MRTSFAAEKLARLTAATVSASESGTETLSLDGYEIRHGRACTRCLGYAPWFDADAARPELTTCS